MDDNIGFICTLLVVPKARLGLDFESGAGYEKRRIIRRILNIDAEAAGLRIGDNVLSINGLDVSKNTVASDRDMIKWRVGQEIQVTIARDGKELTLPIKPVENQP